MTAGVRLQFLEFTFDVETGELAGPEGTVRLQPQPAAVLRTMLSSAGVLVTRDALKRAVWPDTVVEADQGLNYCVRQIRIALGEDAEGGRFIETLPRRGYRFLPPVLPMARAAPIAPGATGAVSSSAAFAEPIAQDAAWSRAQPASTNRRTLMTLGTTLLLVAVALLWRERTSTSSGAVTVAVLPLTTKETTEWAAERNRAVTEALVTTLTNMAAPNLAVIGPATTERYTGSQQSQMTIGSQLGAQFVLSGGIRLSDSTLFVQAIRVRDGTHVFAWREAVQGRDANLLASLVTKAAGAKLR